MRRFLALFLLGLSLLFWSSSASANGGTYINDCEPNTTATWYGSPQTQPYIGITGGKCNYGYFMPYSGTVSTKTALQQVLCADGAKESYVGGSTGPTSTYCATNCPASGSKYGDSSTALYTTFLSSTVCVAGCQMRGSGAVKPSSGTGLSVVVGPFTVESVHCDGSGANGSAPGPVTPPAGTPPPISNPCPAGTTQIGVDSSGIAMCSGTATPPPPTPQPTTTQQPQVTNGDGSKTDVTTTTKTNADGSTTTTTTTKLTGTDGKVTSTTTSSTGNVPGTGGTGSLGGIGATPPTKGQEDNPNDLCKLHPDLNICKNSSVSGDCAAVVCTGDAITCAMLRQQKKEYCENTTADANYTLGGQLIAGNDPQKGSFPTPANGAQVAMPSSLSSSTFLGSACFPDTHFSLRGYSFAIPWTSACGYLVAFRYALMFVVLMLSFRMVSGVIFRE